MSLTVKTTVNAPVATVWSAYTTPSDIVHWNAASDDWHTTHATVELKRGGEFCSRMQAKDGSMGFDFQGTYTNVDEHSVLEYEFGGRSAKVTFEPTQRGTDITVSFEPDDSHPVEQQQQGWQAILDNFKNYVERTHC
jgi:uncharacterized protein YndB with AHSA1/START domain